MKPQKSNLSSLMQQTDFNMLLRKEEKLIDKETERKMILKDLKTSLTNLKLSSKDWDVPMNTSESLGKV